MIVSATRMLPAPPDQVWARLVRWEEQPRWMVDAAAVRVLSPRREGPGVRLAVRTRILGVPLLTDVLEVVVWDPPRRLRIAHTGIVRGRGEWRLDDMGERTRFTWAEQLTVPVPVIGELMSRVYRPVMRRMMAASLGRFAAHVGLPPPP